MEKFALPNISLQIYSILNLDTFLSLQFCAVSIVFNFNLEGRSIVLIVTYHCHCLSLNCHSLIWIHFLICLVDALSNFKEEHDTVWCSESLACSPILVISGSFAYIPSACSPILVISGSFAYIPSACSPILVISGSFAYIPSACSPILVISGSFANISSTMYYHNMPETTYYIYICGTERRNMICETLTIHIQGKYFMIGPSTPNAQARHMSFTHM